DVVLGRHLLTLLGLAEPLQPTALEVLTVLLNAAVLFTIALLAGSLAERYYLAQRSLENQRKDFSDLQAFRDLIFQSVGSGLIAVNPYGRVTAFNRAAESITGVTEKEALGQPWEALFGREVDLEEARQAVAGPGGQSRRYEIRHPLAAVSGAIGALVRELPADPGRERLVEIVLREAERLNRIIRDFLEYARPAPMASHAVDLADLLEEVVLLIEHRSLPADL